MKKNVLDFIKLIKGMDADEIFGEDYIKENLTNEEYEWAFSKKIIEEIFTCGACGRFALILNFIFEDCRFYMLPELLHIITEINGRLYDVTGDVTEKYKDSVKEELDLKELENSDCVDNYDFHSRGPII